MIAAVIAAASAAVGGEASVSDRSVPTRRSAWSAWERCQVLCSATPKVAAAAAIESRTSAVAALSRSAAGWSDSGSRPRERAPTEPARESTAGRTRTARTVAAVRHSTGASNSVASAPVAVGGREWTCHQRGSHEEEQDHVDAGASDGTTPAREIARLPGDQWRQHEDQGQQRCADEHGHHQTERDRGRLTQAGGLQSRQMSHPGVHQGRAGHREDRCRRGEQDRLDQCGGQLLATPQSEGRQELALLRTAVGDETPGEQQSGQRQGRPQQDHERQCGAGRGLLRGQPMQRRRQLRGQTRDACRATQTVRQQGRAAVERGRDPVAACPRPWPRGPGGHPPAARRRWTRWHGRRRDRPRTGRTSEPSPTRRCRRGRTRPRTTGRWPRPPVTRAGRCPRRPRWSLVARRRGPSRSPALTRSPRCRCRVLAAASGATASIAAVEPSSGHRPDVSVA